MAFTGDRRTIPELLTSVVTQLADLVRTEGQLARAEMSEKMTLAAAGLGLIVGGAILLVPALVVLLEAAVAALVESGLAPYWSALAIGGGCFIIGLILLLIGVRRLRASRPIPDKTIHQLQRDAAVARSQVRIDHVEKRAA
ncbi:MAG TPA: phage holin family protein [Xanthobacteraceae bacterium]|jgi:membrane protein implicated in regulation of membrane protease activity|nr:phage holin family protein [Xanthobacteraceae bacterium]